MAPKSKVTGPFFTVHGCVVTKPPYLDLMLCFNLYLLQKLTQVWGLYSGTIQSILIGSNFLI